MNIDIKNDLEKSQMTVTVTVDKKKKSSDETKTFIWKDVVKLVKEYSPPHGYVLGECQATNQKVSNNFETRLHAVWVFDLHKKLSAKPVKKITTGKKTAPKKTKSEA